VADLRLHLRDFANGECLTWDAGLSVVRFRYDADWETICAERSSLFGKVEE